ncbi:inhibitor of carbonic anhydrase isoform X2 [Erinaceus europaeus]|uniref:Inhibitor of carbonic anhydrase isoform X2 n=1 Tax=Erinaceus europaeus TaxID=9365 RepID=A0ABM3XVP7_ERIEU|nr:inhibitor of carbonic anhydrase isoform X2 [Erinaceus europaeus]
MLMSMEQVIWLRGGQSLSEVRCLSHGLFQAKEADAVTLEAGEIFDASLAPYNLKPIAAEFYESEEDPQTQHYIVAVVKKGSHFQLNQLRGKKSCLPGLGWSSGWISPLGTLLPSDFGEEAVSKFLSSSCVPCADGRKFPSLCQLCKGTGADKCACSPQEPYFGYSGAFRCLQDGMGDVGFMRHMTVFENLPDPADRNQYELLCKDNTRKPVDQYKDCYLARVPSHAVVVRSVDSKENEIWELLNYIQARVRREARSVPFQFFGSPHGRDLLFTDATLGLSRVPQKMDAAMYLGSKYFSAMQRLQDDASGLNRTVGPGVDKLQRVLWCSVGSQEKAKCDNWSAVSGGILQCATQATTEDCLAAIMTGRADAMSVDGGFVYTADKCGLVPVLAEKDNPEGGSEQLGSKCVDTPVKGYHIVAVVKTSDADLTWNSLRGKKSCHSAVGTAAGWEIPVALIHNQTGSCKLDEFFSQSCAPGSDPDSRLCALCAGGSEPGHVCVPSSRERYYGSSGALRCLVEKGDVAFMKHSAILQNTKGRNSEAWANDLEPEDFQLLCLDGTRKPVTEPQNCHLARVPNRAVVSRKDKAEFVRRMLFNQQNFWMPAHSTKIESLQI